MISPIKKSPGSLRAERSAPKFDLHVLSQDFEGLAGCRQDFHLEGSQPLSR